MLVLNRKSGQRVIINSNIEVVVLKVNKSQVKLGISGPKEVSIHREEVFRKIAGDVPKRDRDEARALQERLPGERNGVNLEPVGL